MVDRIFEGFKKAKTNLSQKSVGKDFLIIPFGFPPNSQYISTLKPKIEKHLLEQKISLLTLLSPEDEDQDGDEGKRRKAGGGGIAARARKTKTEMRRKKETKMRFA